MNFPKIQHVLLDIDGVLKNVRVGNENVLRTIFTTLGLSAYSEELLALRDPMLCSVQEYFATVLETVKGRALIALPGIQTVDDLVAMWCTIEDQLYTTDSIPFFPDARENVRQLVRLGYGIGASGRLIIATNRPRCQAQHVYDRYASYVHGLVTPDLVGTERKNAEMLLRACQHYGINPEEAVLIDDSPNGLESAQGAGITPIIVRSGWPGRISFYDECQAAGICVVDNLAVAAA